MDIDITTVCVALSTGCVAMVIIRYIQARRPVANYPPGPWGIPLLGSLPSLWYNQNYHRYFARLGEKYGNVFSYAYGPRNLVIANGIDIINEALVTRGDDIADRPEDYLVYLYNPQYFGIFEAPYGDSWYNQRHFAHKTLRGFGFGKTSFESKVMEEVRFLIRHFKDNLNKPVDVRDFISNCTANVICSITFGRRYSNFENPKFLEATKGYRDWLIAANSFLFELGNIFPVVRPLLWRQRNTLNKATDSLFSFLMEEVRKKQGRFSYVNEPTDFIESYLKEIESDKEGKFTHDHLKIMIMNLFDAGTETVATTLAWAMLFMMVNPEIQRKVQQELDEVVGRKALPSYSHRGNLPYTEATLLEVQRIASLIPVVPHAAFRDTTLGGYNIPAKSVVWINLWSVHHDPKLYPQPDKFDPNRFLTEDGEVKKNESFLPFGAGRRVCMGESLAKLELFLFFTAMLHQFSFSVPQGSTPPSTDAQLGIFLMPKPYKVVIQERGA